MREKTKFQGGDVAQLVVCLLMVPRDGISNLGVSDFCIAILLNGMKDAVDAFSKKTLNFSANAWQQTTRIVDTSKLYLMT
jgi:hypothetical protein